MRERAPMGCKNHLMLSHKTLEECAQCGRVAGESAQPAGGGVAPWEIALCVDAGAAHAPPGGRALGGLDQERLGTWWRLWGDAQRGDCTDDYWRVVLERGSLGGLSEGIGRASSPPQMTTATPRGDRRALSLR